MATTQQGAMLKNFTTRFVETVTTEKPRAEFFDAHENGLMLRVSRDGTKSWAFRYRRKSDHRRRFVSLGRFPVKSLEDARIAAAKVRIAVAEGVDPAAGIQQRKAAPTFRDVAEDWQKLHARFNRSARVRADDQSMLTRHVLPHIGDMKAHDLSRRQLSLMLAEVRTASDGRKGHIRKGVEPRVFTHRPNRVFALTRGILRWALAEGIITNDPSAGMKRPIKKEPARDRELSPEEIKMFWLSIDKLPATLGLQIALKLALVTAQRIGEVCGIAKNELSLDGPTPVWVIPRARTKNREGHRVPLSPLAVTLIRDAMALQKPRCDAGGAAIDSPYVFPARAKRDKSHGPIEPAAAAVAMFRGRDRLGVAHFRVHDLRRTAATRMAEMGVNPYTISLILNHVSASTSTVTSAVYVRYSFDREKREALNAWGQRLEAILQGAFAIY